MKHDLCICKSSLPDVAFGGVLFVSAIRLALRRQIYNSDFIYVSAYTIILQIRFCHVMCVWTFSCVYMSWSILGCMNNFLDFRRWIVGCFMFLCFLVAFHVLVVSTSPSGVNLVEGSPAASLFSMR